MQPPNTILLVESSATIVDTVKKLCDEPNRLQLAVAGTLGDALTRVTDETFTILLLNLELDDSHGIETLLQIRTAEPDIAIIVLTMADSDELVVEVLDKGAQELVEIKKITRPQFRRAIKTAIARKQANSRARKTEHNKRDDFAAMLAHDLKIPVAGATRIFDLMIEGWLGPLTPGQAEIISKLRDSNNSLLRQIQDMLEVYSYEQSKQPVQLSKFELLPLVVDAVYHFNQQAIHAQVHIISRLPEGLGTIKADEHAIRRLLINVLDNAIKFSPAGATITITGSTVGKSASISISDQGPGIPAKHLEHLFDRFWFGGPDTKYSASTGLGLYLCKRIVEAHGGAINCTSTEGEGADFTISLPLLTAPAASRRTAE